MNLEFEISIVKTKYKKTKPKRVKSREAQGLSGSRLLGHVQQHQKQVFLFFKNDFEFAFVYRFPFCFQKIKTKPVKSENFEKHK